MPPISKLRIDETTCSCDMNYLVHFPHPEKLVEKFLEEHPFICGALIGYATENGTDKLGELIERIGKECMKEKPGKVGKNGKADTLRL